MKSKPKSGTKRTMKFLAKLIISGVALYFVFQKVDFSETLDTISRANLMYFLVAVLLFNFSKLISTFRLKALVLDIGISISNWYNIKLYYIGAFYNLFLPGSIGGDGYKVYLLKQHHGGKTRELISSVLLDRLSGLAALVFLTGGLVFFSSLDLEPLWMFVIAAVMVLVFPVYFVFLRILFKNFVPSFFPTTYLSIATQVLQVACAYFILLSLAVDIGMMDYLALFMVASVVAVIPFTIGGLGARELVFVTGYKYLMIDEHTAIAFTLLFFSITTISAFVGLFLAFSKMERE